MANLFYLYLDNYSFSDCFSTNTIACEAFMPNKKGTRTISKNTQDFLFITHKKLNADNRFFGITDQLTGWPVTIELSIDYTRYERFPVVFVKQNADSATLEYGDIKDYDESVHQGCYVFSFIPFSLVSRIMFETENQLFDSDKSFLPDFLWREDIVSVINQEEFSDTVTFSFQDNEIDKLLSDGKHSAVKESLNANKYQAAILQMVNGTREWITRKCKSSFDCFLLQFFGIDEKEVKLFFAEQNISVPDDLFQINTEQLSLIPRFCEESKASQEQLVYNAIVTSLIENQSKCSPTVVDGLISDIKEKLSMLDNFEEYDKSLDEIEGCVQNAVDFSVDVTIRNIIERHGENSVLKALFYVLKNPCEFEKFTLSLSIYKVDSLTSRRAMIMWGFMNGTKGIPAIEFNRNNFKLWTTIENYSGLFSKCNNVVKAKTLNNASAAGLGLELQCEEIITLEEVHTFLIENIEKIKDAKKILCDIYSIAKALNRKLSKEDPYCVYEITEDNFYSKLPKSPERILSKAETDSFEKDFTKQYKHLLANIKKNPTYNYEAIYSEWVVNNENFRKIWEVREKELKTLYLRLRG